MTKKATKAGPGDVEYANAAISRDYPPTWGLPPGTRHSRERAVWVADRMTAELRARGDHRTARPLHDDDAHRAQRVAGIQRVAAASGPRGDGGAHVRHLRDLLELKRHDPWQSGVHARRQRYLLELRRYDVWDL